MGDLNKNNYGNRIINIYFHSNINYEDPQSNPSKNSSRPRPCYSMRMSGWTPISSCSRGPSACGTGQWRTFSVKPKKREYSHEDVCRDARLLAVVPVRLRRWRSDAEEDRPDRARAGQGRRRRRDGLRPERTGQERPHRGRIGRGRHVIQHCQQHPAVSPESGAVKDRQRGRGLPEHRHVRQAARASQAGDHIRVWRLGPVPARA